MLQHVLFQNIQNDPRKSIYIPFQKNTEKGLANLFARLILRNKGQIKVLLFGEYKPLWKVISWGHGVFMHKAKY